ncbi:DUF5995 family protein [Haloarcula marina]|uniref:DUF5995 family protein n=1 Tax=Haloarcula marina TaxID=2961574 RepID=UPI0020B8ED96|nr:DUF5995 family protein [Halomicroarcula marina]
MTGLAPPSGRRHRRVRSAVRGLPPTRRSSCPPDGTGDPEILSLVADPYTNPGATHERLRALLATFEARDDRRAVFLSIYARMTRAVARRVDADDFADSEWVADYLVAFANLYRQAVYDYERGALGAVAEPWRLAFEAADSGESLVVQDAMLGVNAHINYDLALALDAVGTSPDRATKRADHDRVIGIIERLVDDAQVSLADRDAEGLTALDGALGRLDERATVFTIGECRDSAWRTAVAMASRFRLRRRFARWHNATTSTGAARLVLSSYTSDRLHGTLVDLEQQSGEE